MVLCPCSVNIHPTHSTSGAQNGGNGAHGKYNGTGKNPHGTLPHEEVGKFGGWAQDVVDQYQYSRRPPAQEDVHETVVPHPIGKLVQLGNEASTQSQDYWVHRGQGAGIVPVCAMVWRKPV
jgi:hypothetical protein